MTKGAQVERRNRRNLSDLINVRASDFFLLLAISTFIVTVIILLSGIAIVQGRAAARSGIAVATANLSSVLVQNINNSVHQLDLGLLSILDELSRQKKFGQRDDQTILDHISREDSRHPDALGFRVFDSDGRLRYGVSNIVIRDVDISQRDEFIKLRDATDTSLIVTPPFKGPVTQEWLIAAARRVTNPDGSFGGAIYSAIPTRHFQKLFSDLDLGPGGSVALYHTSFLLTARFPEVRVGTTTISDQLRNIITSGLQSVGFSNLSPVDGVQRTGHARKVGDLPYYISLALADDDWLGEWRQSRNQLILLSAFLIGIVLLGMLTIHRVLSHWKLSVRALAESKEHSLAQTILEEKLRELARTDSLTELLNRRAFIEAGETEFLRGKRFGPNAALLLLDIDHFKQVNDRYGHEAGDRALVSFASILKTVVRTIDVPARFGGEEFVVLLVSTDLSGAMDMAERIRDAVSQIRVTYRGGEFGFTVSIGVTAFKNEDENFSEVIRRADQGMYRAKELGRNRIVMADGIQQAPTD